MEQLKSTLSVAYSTDENFVQITAVSMTSLLTYNPGAKVTILCNHVSSDSITFLKALCERLGGTFVFLDVASRLGELERQGANGYVSYSAYARLFIPQLIPDKRVIYIDGDTLVLGDLKPLTSFDLKGNPVAIGYDCQRVEYRQMIGLDREAPYFNTGVMVIDTAEWNRRDCTKRLLAFIPHVSKRAFFADQDVITPVLGQEVTILPPQYNFLPHYQMFKTQHDVLTITGVPWQVWYTDHAYSQARKEPVIHHFLGHTLGRPWYKESKNPMRKRYCEFALKAGVPQVVQQSRPLELCYRVQWLCWKGLPNWLFVQACRVMYRFFFWHAYGV